MTDAASRIPAVFGGRYDIERKIARGGMADVYLAKDRLLDRPVALKVLFPELSVDPTFVERFRREAQNAARLSHPNIVSVYDWGEEANTYYIVMEYISGKSLSTLLRENGPFQARKAAAIGAEVAAALAFAHRNDVVHRDVKPGNVMLDDRGLVKVTDFGIARARNTTENLTQTGAVMGTATYFSPEQAQGLTVDQRSDVYSLGVVLYEMVAGKPPFQGDNPLSIAYKHVKELPPSLVQVNTAIPAPFAAIVERAMAKSPSARYETADNLRGDLLRFANGQPIASMPNALPDHTQALSRDAIAAAGVYADRTTTVPRADLPLADSGRAAPKKRGVLGPVLLFLVLVAAIVGAAFWYIEGSAAATKPNVQVPTITNQAKGDAETALSDKGLRWREIATNSNAKKDTVVAQDPQGGTMLKKGAYVNLSISNGPAPITLVSYVNQTGDAARKALTALGLTGQINQVSSDAVPSGSVVSQSPDAGSSVQAGDTITLNVSTGPQKVPVPDVTGFTIATASQTLSDAGLRTSYPDGTDQSAIVESTNPAAQTMVAKGTTITLTPAGLITTPPTTDSSTTTSAGGNQPSTTSTTSKK